jgi:outer membrane immunogenic protein
MIYRIVMMCFVVSLGSMSGNAFAGLTEGAYAGVQYASFDFSFEDVSEDFSPTGLIGRAGSNINQYFSIEGRLGFGLSDDTVSVSDGVTTASVSIELDTLIGAYGVGHVPLGKSSSIYALVGLTQVDATASAALTGSGSASFSDDESDLSYGIGADIGILYNLWINVEYVQYLDKSDLDLSAIALGIKFGF